MKSPSVKFGSILYNDSKTQILLISLPAIFLKIKYLIENDRRIFIPFFIFTTKAFPLSVVNGHCPRIARSELCYGLHFSQLRDCINLHYLRAHIALLHCICGHVSSYYQKCKFMDGNSKNVFIGNEPPLVVYCSEIL